jgi:bifunctional DNA-binding transcriptional regulator/antitoxin component of YhaV-PrlF toxin-antitoxin module
MERKIINVSGKRQITIPQKFYEALGMGAQVECIMGNDAIIIRPFQERGGSEFASEILADLIEQGLCGQELLDKFNEMSRKVGPAVERLISEADKLARNHSKGPSLDDIFGAED